jgi:hypothetical protein
VKVLIKEPGKPYEFRDIEKTLEAMQAIVGGYIEVITLRNGLDLICDEEGRLKNKEPNAVVRTATKSPQQIVGTFFVCRTNGEEFAGFDEDSPDAEQLAAAFSVYEFGEYQRKKWLPSGKA